MKRLLVAAAAAALLLVGSAGASFPGRNGLVVFARGAVYGLDSELYTMHADGTGLRRLTRNGVHDFSPAWAPDGSRLAFVRVLARGADQVFVSDARGGNARRLVRLRGTTHDPAWSPDGSQIAFVRHARPLDGIWVATADGRRARKVTDHRLDYAPAWSPDGKTLAFNRGGEIYAVDADGQNVRLLLGGKRHPPGAAIETVRSGPFWSPDGGRLAFIEFSECCNNKRPRDIELVLLAADGDVIERRPIPLGGDVAWSPDGRLLIQGQLEFMDVRSVVLDAASGRMRRSIRNGGEAPDWQPVCGGRLVCGTAKGDRIDGRRGDRLFGRGGSDTISAVDGSFDVVGCGPGRDTVRADAADLVGVDCERVSRSS